MRLPRRGYERIDMKHRWMKKCGITILLGLLIVPDRDLDAAAIVRNPPAIDVSTSLRTITTNDLAGHVRVLSSDEFEGRSPGTRGEELTVNYLTSQFQRIGLKPGNPNGSYIQEVPLMGLTTEPTISFQTRGGPITPGFPGDCVILSRRQMPEISVADSDVVFVGHGIVAPEYDWDDYKDVDVRGKTLLMLVNDPPVPDPADSSKLDEKVFRGRGMTYYGRWTYKYEIATTKGAAAVIIVHETGPAGYPWFVVVGSNSRENMDLRASDRNLRRVPIEGWMTWEMSRQLCAAAGRNLEVLKAAAVKRDFHPVSLAAKASFTVHNSLRSIASRNVIAKIDGSDPKLKDECVIYTAHWDHIGRNSKLDGDQIFNGAKDNASGTAGLLELAEAFIKLKPAPRRTVLFLAVTAEEKGLLGAKYYATHPLYPVERTLANINMDSINVWGKTRDIEIVGFGQNDLEDALTHYAASRGRTARPDAQPEKGSYFRSDHFEFAKVGVPALNAGSGVDYIGRPEGWGLKRREAYTADDYHKVSDEMTSDWDLSGAVEDLQLLFEVGYAVAQGERWPRWKEGSEFRALRENKTDESQRR